MRSFARQNGDPIVHLVLEKIHDFTGIDTAAIVPDYKLGSDFGMERTQIQLLLVDLVKELNLPVPFEACRIEDTTPRNIVQQLKLWMVNSNQGAA